MYKYTVKILILPQRSRRRGGDPRPQRPLRDFYSHPCHHKKKFPVYETIFKAVPVGIPIYRYKLTSLPAIYI